ncbi:MAG: ABC1 kinase family protein [Candidatus Promineifilaceae bacterium]
MTIQMPQFPQANSQPEPDVERIDRVRYSRTTFFFARVILSIIFWDLLIGRIPFLGRIPRRNRSHRLRLVARRFRVIAADMGGVMIKLGQFLSARVDVLPPEIIEELLGLQDEVPPVDQTEVDEALTRELGNPLDIFAEIEKEVMGAASLGQTYRAWLRTPEPNSPSIPVVIKVQRPNIESLVYTDLAALRVVAKWIMRYRPISSRADVPALMEEFAVTLWEELDYKSEVKNAAQFAEMFEGYEGLHTPKFYEEHCTDRVLVMENVEGLKLTELDRIREIGIDPHQVADRLVDAYFSQVFEKSFFHADPHPGNLFLRERPDKPRADGEPMPFDLIFIDFGMMGRVSAETRNLLQQVLISVTTRNARGLTKAYDELGFFLQDADLERIAEAQEKILNQVWGRDLADLANPDMGEIQELGSEFKDLLFDFPFQVPQNFIYLGRALGMLSGLSSMLNPTINPWFYIEDYGQRMLRSRETRQATGDYLLKTAREYAQIPGQVKHVLGEIERGKLKLQVKPDRKLEQQLDRLEKRGKQLNTTVVTAALLICGTILYVSAEPRLASIFWTLSGTIYLWSGWRNL